MDLDLNLLTALDALLAEGSVTGAARHLGLSSSAMSRTLTRLRLVTGDPLLVRAGRGLVPTPRATELRDLVHELTRNARAILQPKMADVDLATLEMKFTIRVSEAFLAFLSVPLVAAVTEAAPLIRLRFAPKLDKDARPLREGQVDLDIGVLGTSAPEIRTQLLFYDTFVGVTRADHALISGAEITPERFIAYNHVGTSRDEHAVEPIDSALEHLGLKRNIMIVVPGYPDAMRIARQSDFVAVIPRSCLGNSSASGHGFISDLHSFELPIPVPEFKISAMWHPRMNSDPAHLRLREIVMSVCRAAYPPRW